jgi:glycosyltransferase involved in cell wall biosynthesis
MGFGLQMLDSSTVTQLEGRGARDDMSPESTLEAGRAPDACAQGAVRLKRVLFALDLDPAGKFGSLEEQVLALARSFRARDSLFLPVYVGPLDRESARQYAREGLTALALDFRSFRIGTLRELLRLIRKHQIEVVHWNFYHPLLNGYLWALSILRPGLLHYFTDHTSRPAAATGSGRRGLVKSALKRILTSRYRKVFCISDFVLGAVRGRAGSRAERVHYFVNTDRFQPDAVVRREVRRARGAEGEFTAVIVAYLIKEKGVDIAIRALAELPGDVVLWVVGDGPERGSLEALASRLGVSSRARFWGQERNVAPFMQAADCAVCPSVWAEAVGLVNLEAQACGLPVIASRIGGIPEFIDDGNDGLLFRPGDDRQLAGLLLRLYADPELRGRMGAAARARAKSAYSTERGLREQLEFYRRAEP